MKNLREISVATKKEAYELAKRLKGVAEGPFYDDSKNASWIVFYEPTR